MSTQPELVTARRWLLRAALEVLSAEQNLADQDFQQLRYMELDRRAIELAGAVEKARAELRAAFQGRNVTSQVHHVRDGDAGLSADKG